MKRAASRPGGSAAPLRAVLAALGGVGLLALTASGISAADGALDREARLAVALEDYAAALGESDRGARVAGFARAERAFASLASDGVDTPALWTNLGNAALQAGRVGQAVLAYHRALALDPGAVAAAQNLAHVRSRLPEGVPRPGNTEGGARDFDLARVPADLRHAVAGTAFLGAAIFTALAVRRRDAAWRALAIACGLVWGVALAAPLVAGGDGRAPIAVLTGDGVAARSADSSLAPLAFPDPLPAGVEVRRLEVRGDWARVRLANGRDVWVRASSVSGVEDREAR